MEFSESGILAPHMLWTLLLVPCFALFLYLRQQERMRRVARIGAVSLSQWPIVYCSLPLLIFLLLSLSVLRPYKGYEEQKVKGYAGTIMVLFDISKSMKTNDLPPNRFVFARRKLRDFIDLIASEQPGRSIGIILFSGESYVFAPPTVDYSVLRTYAKSIDLDLISRPGSSLDRAIENAIQSIKQDHVEGAALLVMSDGESEESVSAVTRVLEKEKLPAYTLGIGTVQGKPIPLGGGVYLKDLNNEIVVSKLEEQPLIELAERTGGLYKRASLGDSDLRVFLAHPRLDFGTEEARASVFIYHELGPLLSLLTLLMLCMYQVHELAVKRKIRSINLLLTLSLFLPCIAQGADFCGNLVAAGRAYKSGDYERSIELFNEELTRNSYERPKVLLGLGSAHYKMGKHSEAAKFFEQVVGDEVHANVKYSAYHNLGNALYYSNLLEEAIKAYEKALVIHPTSTETKENLDFVKNQLQKQEENKNDKQDNDQTDQEQSGSDENTDPKQSEEEQDSSDESNQSEDPQEQGEQEESSQEQNDSKSDKQTGDQSGDEEKDSDSSLAEGNDKDSPEGDSPSEMVGQSNWEREIEQEEAKAWLESLPDSPVMMQTLKNKEAMPRGGQTW